MPAYPKDPPCLSPEPHNCRHTAACLAFHVVGGDPNSRLPVCEASTLSTELSSRPQIPSFKAEQHPTVCTYMLALLVCPSVNSYWAAFLSWEQCCCPHGCANVSLSLCLPFFDSLHPKGEFQDRVVNLCPQVFVFFPTGMCRVLISPLTPHQFFPGCFVLMASLAQARSQ